MFTVVALAVVVLAYETIGQAGWYLVIGLVGTVFVAFGLAALVRLLR